MVDWFGSGVHHAAMGFFDAFKPEKWGTLAGALQLAPFKPSGPFLQSMCFRHMERARGSSAASMEPSFAHWLWGQRRGVQVVVLQYETGSGSSTTTWTAAIARIDPPLHLGLEVTAENLFSRVFGAADILVGHGDLDSKLRIHAYDAPRAAMLFSAADEEGRRLSEYTAGLVRTYSSRVADSTVEVSQQGVVTDPEKVAAMLDRAVDLATWLAARRARLPQSPAEQSQVREWQRFANVSGFQADLARVTAHGSRDGVLVELGQEFEGQSIYTALSARFPGAAPAKLYLERTLAPGFIQGIFSQDIKVGDPAFDAAYKVQGEPEDVVRRLLSRPAVLQALNDAARRTREVRVGQHGLFLRVEAQTMQASQLDSLVQWACTVAREVIGAGAVPTPYR